MKITVQGSLVNIHVPFLTLLCIYIPVLIGCYFEYLVGQKLPFGKDT
jgi:hypothetical protein